MNRVVLLLSLSATSILLCSPTEVRAQGVAPRQMEMLATQDIFTRALYRHIPVMRFDSGEDFFPLRVTAITNNTGNRLLRENGAFLARRDADGSGLNIRYLRGINIGFYPNNQAILAGDMLDERDNDPDTAKEDARRFQTNSVYRDRIYGRVVRITNGDRLLGAWLQYWFFYYYNDFPRVNTGDHEGDWEMVQVRVNPDGDPQLAVYAQHDTHTWCSWPKVQKSGSRPIVFVALGSHASYFRATPHGQDRDVDGQVTRRLRLIRIGNNSPQWLNWPGQWGASEGVDGNFRSPKGPKRQGEKWTNPEAFFVSGDEDDDCK